MSSFSNMAEECGLEGPVVGTNDNAAIAGEVAILASEVQPVLNDIELRGSLGKACGCLRPEHQRITK